MEYNNERPHESLNNLTPEEYRLMAEKPELSKSAWNSNRCAYIPAARRGKGKEIYICT
ncbi:IS3 family element, transposase orfB [Klebsiella variicola]|nr:IS3 family element, transposase orfB [Klebsiella pneumoniae]SVN26325.1 IS3 family element, transposase orfB [Klebsiella pneumoniae]SXE67552.1 IS3 family element, transposase orfB [Klebsiella variicola]SXK23383.1 IS3 family element, transposase orfB [Klebsiella pneumoniae]